MGTVGKLGTAVGVTAGLLNSAGTAVASGRGCIGGAGVDSVVTVGEAVGRTTVAAAVIVGIVGMLVGRASVTVQAVRDRHVSRYTAVWVNKFRFINGLPPQKYLFIL